MASSKKGFSAHQLHRTIGVTYKTAWFMMHRLREAMTTKAHVGPMGSGGGTVEADETFWGNNKRSKKSRAYKGRGYEHKMKVVSLVERGGEVRSFHVPAVNGATLKPMREQIAKEAHLMTDDNGSYYRLDKYFASHSIVQHSNGEYGRVAMPTQTPWKASFRSSSVVLYEHTTRGRATFRAIHRGV